MVVTFLQQETEQLVAAAVVVDGSDITLAGSLQSELAMTAEKQPLNNRHFQKGIKGSQQTCSYRAPFNLHFVRVINSF